MLDLRESEWPQIPGRTMSGNAHSLKYKHSIVKKGSCASIAAEQEIDRSRPRCDRASSGARARQHIDRAEKRE
jgi:hypothetical protein